jgi:hypothetical protein
VTDIQFTIGAVTTGLILGWIAHEHGWLGWLWEQLTARRSWRPFSTSRGPDVACNRFGADWRAVANDKNVRWM